MDRHLLERAVSRDEIGKAEGVKMPLIKYGEESLCSG